MEIAEIAAAVRGRPGAQAGAQAGAGAAPLRRLVGIAGPPGAGKSTLAAALADAIPGARVVPMDGFHLDNSVLEARGLLAVKGAPQTFDAAGFRHLLARLRHEEEVAIPIFDRSVELSRAAADVVSGEDRVLIVEGNYLLLEDPPWQGLAFDLTLFLEVPEAELHRRLVARWRSYGLSEAAAEARASGNDRANGRLVRSRSRPADLVISWKAGETRF